MKQKDSVNLDRVVELYDPHPGFAGAAIPIPGPIKKIADELDGQTMTLKEAVCRLERAGIGTVEVVPKYQFISLLLKQPHGGCPGAQHMFRIIRFR